MCTAEFNDIPSFYPNASSIHPPPMTTNKVSNITKCLQGSGEGKKLTPRGEPLLGYLSEPQRQES